MEISDFTAALDELGIKYYEAGQSLKIQTCPECGSDQFKVHLRLEIQDGLLFGRCYAGKCQTNYSSFKYLLMMDMPYHDVKKAHGQDSEEALRKMVPEVPEFVTVKKEPEPEKTEKPDTDISKFFKLKDWIEHPAAQYAISRGARPEWDWIMIDHTALAVVFVIYDKGEVVGYQKRFVMPDDPRFKTKTSTGFSKSKHVLTIPNGNKPILVVEGPFTAIAAWHFGYTPVCTFGAAVSDEQISQIVGLSIKLDADVGVGFDDDAAGFKGIARIRAAMHWSNKKTFKVKPSIGNDLNDAWQSKGTAVVVEDIVEYNPALPELGRFI